MTLQVRPWREDDDEAVRALVRSVLNEFGFAQAVGGAEVDLGSIAQRYAAPGGGFWVADDDGVLVGTVGIRPKEGRTCELKRLYVRADQRGTGLGQRLYDHAERFARAAGYETILARLIAALRTRTPPLHAQRLLPRRLARQRLGGRHLREAHRLTADAVGPLPGAARRRRLPRHAHTITATPRVIRAGVHGPSLA